MPKPSVSQVLEAARVKSEEFALQYLKIYRKYHPEEIAQELAKGVRIAWMAGYVQCCEDIDKVN